MACKEKIPREDDFLVGDTTSENGARKSGRGSVLKCQVNRHAACWNYLPRGR